MKKVNKVKLMKLMAKSRPDMALFLMLIDESSDPSQDSGTGKTWGMVYLDNVLYDFIALGFTSNQFAGYLSVLQSNGVYRSCDQFFGYVDMDRSAIRG